MSTERRATGAFVLWSDSADPSNAATFISDAWGIAPCASQMEEGIETHVAIVWHDQRCLAWRCAGHRLLERCGPIRWSPEGTRIVREATGS